MKPLRMFELLEPKSLKEASSMVKKGRGNAKILAGGTDTMSCWSGRTFHVGCYTKGIEPKVLRCFGNPKKRRVLINIKGIRGLKGIKKGRQTVRVGALTTLNELMESPLLNTGLAFLKGVIRQIGSVETRNLATVGGNLFTHAPAAGLAPILLCLEAKGIVSDGTKKQQIPLEDLFGGFRKLGELPRLQGGQILVEITIPELKPSSGVRYEKTNVMVSSMSPPVASAAAMLRLNPRKKIVEACRIFVGSCRASYPHRSKEAEGYLINKPFEDAILREAAEMAVAGLEPISDGYGSAEYRMRVAGVMVRRALEKAGNEALANS